jgi:hypothetical protein
MIEWFTKKTPRLGSPLLSFSKLGQVTFNQTAARILQKEPVEYLMIGWDPLENKIAMKAIANTKDPRAYKIRYNDKGNGASFSAKTFLDHAGIEYSERKPIPIEINTNAEVFLEVKIPEAMLKTKSAQLQLLEKGV